MVDPVVHFEIPADDPARAKAFYEQLFGWTITYMKEYDYYGIKARQDGNGIDGGMMKRKYPRQPPMMYTHVASIDATIRKATSLGGKVCFPKTPIGEMGSIAVIQDLEGNQIGLHEISPAGMKEMMKRRATEDAAKKRPTKKAVAKKKKR